MYIYNKPLTKRIDVQKLDILDIVDYAQSIHQVAFSTKGERVILKTSITSYVFGKVGTTFHLFDLDQKGRIKTNENVWVTDFNEFDSGTYCEKSDFLLMEKKGVLKKWNIFTHMESVVSDSFTESLVHAHYNEKRKIYILETDTSVLETDTLDSLQNSIPMNLPDYVSILWCGDSPYVGLLHDTCVEVWNMQATSSVGCFFTSLEKCCCMDVSEDGMHLVIASNDGTLNLFNKIDVKNYTCIDILTGVFDKNLITIHNVWWMREDEILVYSYPKVYRVRLNSNEGATLVLSLENYTAASSCAFIWRLFGTRIKYDKEQNRIYFDVSDKSKKMKKFSRLYTRKKRSNRKLRECFLIIYRQ